MTYVSPSSIHLSGHTVEEAMQLNIENSLEKESAEATNKLLPELLEEFLRNPNQKNTKLLKFIKNVKTETTFGLKLLCTFNMLLMAILN